MIRALKFQEILNFTLTVPRLSHWFLGGGQLSYPPPRNQFGVKTFRLI